MPNTAGTEPFSLYMPLSARALPHQSSYFQAQTARRYIKHARSCKFKKNNWIDTSSKEVLSPEKVGFCCFLFLGFFFVFFWGGPGGVSHNLHLYSTGNNILRIKSKVEKMCCCFFVAVLVVFCCFFVVVFCCLICCFCLFFFIVLFVCFVCLFFGCCWVVVVFCCCCCCFLLLLFLFCFVCFFYFVFSVFCRCCCFALSVFVCYTFSGAVTPSEKSSLKGKNSFLKQLTPCQ